MASFSRTQPPPPEGLEGRVSRLIGSSDIRFTAGRRLVVRALAAAPGPLTATELHGRLGGRVPLSSLYRSLVVLEETGVLAREHDPAGIGRYELAEGLREHHHHLVCAGCGEVRDVAVSPAAERQITALVGRLAARAGFSARRHRLDIEGMCRECRS